MSAAQALAAQAVAYTRASLALLAQVVAVVCKRALTVPAVRAAYKLAFVV